MTVHTFQPPSREQHITFKFVRAMAIAVHLRTDRGLWPAAPWTWVLLEDLRAALLGITLHDYLRAVPSSCSKRRHARLRALPGGRSKERARAVPHLIGNSALTEQGGTHARSEAHDRVDRDDRG
jgi:hypothetical protein